MDNVSIAFELMQLELNSEVMSLNAEGAKLFHDSQYEKAKELSERGKALSVFCETIITLSDRWAQDFSLDFPESETQVREAVRKLLFASKASKTGLRVQFTDGTVIEENTAAGTLVEVIRKVGFEAVRKLKIYVNKENLVSVSESPTYRENFSDPYYIKTHSNTDQKKRNLERISEKLGLDLKIEVLS